MFMRALLIASVLFTTRTDHCSSQQTPTQSTPEDEEENNEELIKEFKQAIVDNKRRLVEAEKHLAELMNRTDPFDHQRDLAEGAVSSLRWSIYALETEIELRQNGSRQEYPISSCKPETYRDIHDTEIYFKGIPQPKIEFEDKEKFLREVKDTLKVKREELIQAEKYMQELMQRKDPYDDKRNTAEANIYALRWTISAMEAELEMHDH